MSEPSLSLPFPIDLVIRDTPRSLQAKRGKEQWKQRVRELAKAHVGTLMDFFFLDERPLAVTIFYFPPAMMQGDVDNIVKLILDGMLYAIYPNDRVIERVVAQKFEPGIEAVFRSVTPALEQALNTERPVIYVRIDDDLDWRQVP